MDGEMDLEITKEEWFQANEIEDAMIELRNSGQMCASSCGCRNDPIVVIVKAMRCGRQKAHKESPDA